MESPSVDLRYQMVGGFLRKVRKTFVFAVQIEKTEKNDFQKEWRKKAF